MRRAGIVYALAGLFALCVPILGIYPIFMMKLLCFAMFACAFNLLLGFSGMLSFGHAAFFGTAAYTTGWLVTAHGWGTVPAILAGIMCRRGSRFGHWPDRHTKARNLLCDGDAGARTTGVFRLSGGALHRRRERLQDVPRGSLIGVLELKSDVTMYYVVLAAFAAVFALIRRIVHSPFGQVLKAIRDNEPRAISLGYDINRYKLLAFVLSATLSGLAGSLKTLVLGFTTLSDVLQANSGEVILMTLLGGSGTFAGPVVGAALVVTLQEYLSDIVGGWVTVIIGGVFVACVLAFRRGIVGELAALRPRR